MSTRSQIRFVQRIDHTNKDGEKTTTERTAQVYRHSDGYPSAVIQSLDLLSTLQNVTRTERDPAYVAANFIFLNKLQGMGLYLNRTGGAGESLQANDIIAIIEDNDISRLASLNQPHFLLGYGVENPTAGIHGDEEYLYIVELPAGGAFDDPGEWMVKVSSHNGFPRWEGPTEEAFDRASWQYEGSLSGAVEEFVAKPV